MVTLRVLTLFSSIFLPQIENLLNVPFALLTNSLLRCLALNSANFFSIIPRFFTLALKPLLHNQVQSNF